MFNRKYIFIHGGFMIVSEKEHPTYISIIHCNLGCTLPSLIAMRYTLPKTYIAPKNGGWETIFLWGFGLYSEALAVSLTECNDNNVTKNSRYLKMKDSVNLIYGYFVGWVFPHIGLCSIQLRWGLFFLGTWICWWQWYSGCWQLKYFWFPLYIEPHSTWGSDPIGRWHIFQMGWWTNHQSTRGFSIFWLCHELVPWAERFLDHHQDFLLGAGIRSSTLHVLVWLT